MAKFPKQLFVTKEVEDGGIYYSAFNTLKEVDEDVKFVAVYELKTEKKLKVDRILEE